MFEYAINLFTQLILQFVPCLFGILNFPWALNIYEGLNRGGGGGGGEADLKFTNHAKNHPQGYFRGYSLKRIPILSFHFWARYSFF